MIRLCLSVIAVSLFFITGCAIPGKHPDFRPLNLTPRITSGQYVQKTDNFLFILDASESMRSFYGGRRKLNIAKDIIRNIHQTLPAVEFMGALRTTGNAETPDDTEMICGFSDYAFLSDLANPLDSVRKAGGKSRIGLAIDRAREDLSIVDGRTALIILSDGSGSDDAVGAARKLTGEIGDRVCIYTICVGRDNLGCKMMTDVAADGCGFAENADNLDTPENIADFVQKIFLAEPAKEIASVELPLPDQTEAETPNIAAPEPVTVIDAPNVAEIPQDTDGDGIYDATDRCPGTPRGVTVNDQGCWVIDNILFVPGRWTVRPEYYSTLDRVAEALVENPGLHIEIRGHTDDRGTDAENMDLSEKRARAVMVYLLNRGIEPERLEALGFGFSIPLASNNTGEGRAINRRVQLEPMRIEG